MTPDVEAAERFDPNAVVLVRRTTREQGLPERVEDPTALADLAAAFRPRREPKVRRNRKAA